MIHFVNDLNPARLRTAFNNDVAEFYTDSTAGSLYADITATGLNVRLYPNPDGKYYFNFRPFVSALINTRNFEDTLQTSISANNPADFIYNYTAGSYLALAVTFTLGLATGTIYQPIQKDFLIKTGKIFGFSPSVATTSIEHNSPYSPLNENFTLGAGHYLIFTAQLLNPNDTITQKEGEISFKNAL